jgi:hypothetical protein
MLLKKLNFFLIVLFLVTINLNAQNILTTFFPSQVTKVDFFRGQNGESLNKLVPIVRVGYNSTKVNLPRSFYLGDGTSRNSGLCNWITNNYTFRVGSQATVEYIITDGGKQYKYYFDIFRERTDYYICEASWVLVN